MSRDWDSLGESNLLGASNLELSQVHMLYARYSEPGTTEQFSRKFVWGTQEDAHCSAVRTNREMESPRAPTPGECTHQRQCVHTRTILQPLETMNETVYTVTKIDFRNKVLKKTVGKRMRSVEQYHPCTLKILEQKTKLVLKEHKQKA